MRRESRPIIHWALALVIGSSLAGSSLGQPPSPPAALGQLTREEAVRQAILFNPQLATVRKQVGYAETAIIVARTYPYNPIYTGYVTSATGPLVAGITNRVYQEHYISLEVELRGQTKIRRAVAAATVSRIDWEISQQEIAVQVAVIRAYNTVLYRQQKLAFYEQGIKLNERAFEQMRKQADAGKVKQGDLALARADLEASRRRRGQAKTTLAVARSELRKLLGTLDDSFEAVGALDVPLPSIDATALTKLALGQRADLQARQAAVCEAEAVLRLVVANRFGNPSIGPYFEYDPTSITYLGARLSMPLAIFNSKKAEVRKAETDVMRIRSEVAHLELAVSQDVQAALARLADANKWAAAYETEVLPGLYKALNEVERLFAKNDPSVDLARVITVTRSWLKSSEARLDARFEVNQAEADLALAAAEPALAMGPGTAPAVLPGHQK